MNTKHTSAREILKELAVELCEYVDKGHANGRPAHFTHKYTSKALAQLLALLEGEAEIFPSMYLPSSYLHV